MSNPKLPVHKGEEPIREINIRVPESLWKRVGSFCFSRDEWTKARVVRHAIKEFLDKREELDHNAY